jgi:hypothetical protein
MGTPHGGSKGRIDNRRCAHARSNRSRQRSSLMKTGLMSHPEGVALYPPIPT